MKQKIDQGYCLFGAEALLGRLQELTKEIEGVRAAEDIEYIHRMRVASRRMRAAFALFESCLPRKRQADWQLEIKRITRALGAARDLDVQLDWLQHCLEGVTERRQQTGIKRLLLRLRQQRDRAQAKVLTTLDELTASRVTDDMGQALRQMLVQARLQQVEANSPELYHRAAEAISLKLEEFLAYEAYVYHPDHIAELHAMRIAAKRLRYTMEIFAPLYESKLKSPLRVVKDVQEILGDLHDTDVWIQFLPQFLEDERARAVEYYGHPRAAARFKAGIALLKADRQQHRNEQYEKFVAFWQRTQERGVWSKLRDTVQAKAPTVAEDQPEAPTLAPDGAAPELDIVADEASHAPPETV